VNLSTGQRKRLALLTAYLEDRPIYVFDEWAADQDPSFRKVFYEELIHDLKAEGKTILVITHDDRYFHLADRHFEMRDGQMAERDRQEKE
jgi:putative ATP-binding cassette transporter